MKLYRDYLVLAGGQVAGRLVGFLAFAWLARRLDGDGYAAVEYVVALAAILATLIDAGSSVVAARQASRVPTLRRALARAVPRARIVAGAGVFVLLALWTAFALPPAIPPALVALFAVALLAQPWRQEWLLQATGRMGAVSATHLLRDVVFACAVVATVHGPGDLLKVGGAELVAVLAGTLLCLRFLRGHVAPEPATAGCSVRSVLGEGVVVTAGTLLSMLTQYAPLFLVAAMQGGAVTASFAAAARLVSAMTAFSYLYHYNLFPELARRSGVPGLDAAALAVASCRLTAWVGVLVALALTLLAEPLVTLAFGARLASAAPLLQVMAWSLPIVVCSGHARWALSAAGAQAHVAWAQGLGLVATIAVAAGLAGVLGATAYALAALAGSLAVWIAAHHLARQAGLQPPPFGLLVRPALLALAIVGVNGLAGAGPGIAAVALACFALVAPLVDPRLRKDVPRLAHARAVVRDAA